MKENKSMTLATKKNMTRYKLHDVLLTGNPDCTLDQWNKLISTYLLLTDKETKEEARAREAENKKEEWNNTHVKDLDGEVWKPIIGYEGLYEFSNKLRVKSLIRVGVPKEHIMKQYVNNIGYLQVGLAKNRKTKTTYIHRLAWEYAHDKQVPAGKVVNHISGDFTDNRPENLNIMTQKENCNWTSRGLTPAQKRANNPKWVEHIHNNPNFVNALKARRKPIVITHLATGTQFFFDSVTEASNFFGIDKTCFRNTTNGKQHQTKGFKATYSEWTREQLWLMQYAKMLKETN